jgi:hypothetical protein
MIPKKYKNVLAEYSEQFENPEIISDIVNFFWDDVATNLRNINYPSIYIEQLGEFNIKHWILTKKILEYTGLIERNPGQTFNQRIKKQDSKLQLEKMIKLQKELADEYSKKLNKKQQRNDYRRSKKDLEQ